MSKKVLLIQGTISRYRVPVYNIIAKSCDLTVMYSTGKVPDGCEFKTVFAPVSDKKRFIVHTENLRKTAGSYDVVIGMFTFNWLSNYLLAFGPRRYKFIPWGIGVPASYSVRYDDPSKKLNSFFLRMLVKKADASVFYTDYPREKYSAMGIDPAKMFVAHNTVQVLPADENAVKDSVLFIGTLYRAKSVMNMLDIYLSAYRVNPDVPALRIVGGGDEFDDIKAWTEANGMQEKVILEGPVYDEEVLSGFFSRAFACVSLGQAGLSVQKSMGYGVPFITVKDSYTGGERFDIEDGVNGVLLDREEDLKDVLLDICASSGKYLAMGRRAYDFYHENRTIEQMAAGVTDAIKYLD